MLMAEESEVIDLKERSFKLQKYDNVNPERLIPEKLLKWCINLVVEHMEYRYSKSASMPWNKSAKVAEMKDHLTKYLIISDANSADPVAFASYQLTTEADVNDQPIPVVYCYEVHVIKACRGFGIGKQLIDRLESIGRQESKHKIMLTAFQATPTARAFLSPIKFYEKLGYKADPISPSQYLSKKEARFYDYEILSKSLL